jgi:hypothetical protein
MDSKIEQCVCNKFCVKLGKSDTETLEIIREAFGEHSLSWAAVFEWHSCFKASRVSVEDDERSGQPSTSKTTENVEKIRTHPLIHREFVPPKMTVNSDFYCDVLRCLRENVRRKRPELWRNHNWLLYHNNVPTRTHVPENHRVFD